MNMSAKRTATCSSENPSRKHSRKWKNQIRMYKFQQTQINPKRSLRMFPMELLMFIITTISVTVSGALAPGPLFFTLISHGTKSGAKGGLLFSVGHTLVEFPLVILLAFGFLTAASQPAVKIVTGFAGGATLLVFGALQIRDSTKSRFESDNPSGIASKNPMMLGVIFTGLNPFFIAWWLTVGGKLILDALVFASFAGILLMYAAHVWIDYAWLTLVAHLARLGTNISDSKTYRGILAVFGGILLCFGFLFLLSAYGTL